MTSWDIAFRRRGFWASGVRLLLIASGVLLLVVPLSCSSAEQSAKNDRVFELRTYHAMPGKLPLMESRFRETTSKVLARHGLRVIGFWVTQDEKDNSFIFLLAHASREAAQRNWEAFRQDPEFQQIVAAERNDKTLERADVIWLRPTDFSPTK